MVVIEDNLFFKTAQVGTEGLAFDGGQLNEIREWKNLSWWQRL